MLATILSVCLLNVLPLTHQEKKTVVNLLASPNVYGGTHNQIKVLLPRYGITPKFAKDDSVEAMEALIDNNTKVLFCESVGNPHCNVSDIPALAEVAHRRGIPLVVDNTFGACGAVARPLDLGADIVVESATKVCEL